MIDDLSKYTEFLVGIGTKNIAHTEGSFLAHLIQVFRDLKRWGFDEAVCLAGLFHSIYGTDKFREFSLPLERRDEVRALIGERAERLAFLYCAMDRKSFDCSLEKGVAPYQMTDRFTGEQIEFSADDFEDICGLQLVDWLEQVPRSKQWDYRRETHRRIADRMGEFAQQEYERVYALENQTST